MINTNNNHYFVGIDVSKLTLDIILTSPKTGLSKHYQVKNNEKGFDQFERWLKKHEATQRETLMCCEHTGRYGEHLHVWAAQREWKLSMQKTTILKKVSGEHPRKGDKYDAGLLAEYAFRYMDRLQVKPPKPQPVRYLGRLRSERREMVDSRSKLKQKVTEAHCHAVPMDELVALWQKQITLLDGHIKALEQGIEEIIAEDSYLSEANTLVRSSPGVGPVLSTIWLSHFAGQDRLDPRKISSWAGFAPNSYRSGTTMYKPDSSSGYGDSEMRRVMHQAARSVATHNPHYREYYQRKAKEGKPPLVIINNIINKIIRTICALWNNKTSYDTDHLNKFITKANNGNLNLTKS